MYVTNLATTQQHVALKSKFLAQKNAADMFLSITKFSVAAMFRNIIAKLYAAAFLNTMTYAIHDV